MLKSDIYYKESLEELRDHGTYDKNPRPKWKDGTPAHSKFITQVTMSYDLDKGEFPLPTIRHTSVKMGIREILAIYQTQTNSLKGFLSHNVTWWEAWMNKDGNLGKAYSYNLESHRYGEHRERVTVKQRLCEDEIVFSSQGTVGAFELENFSVRDYNVLRVIWDKAIKEGITIKWAMFGDFLRDVRYLPQYFLAKEEDFKGWSLNKHYFYSNAHSKETSIFHHDKFGPIKVKSKKRFELSRNQIVDLLSGLEKDPYGRRHMLSLYNWKNQPHKTLVECAFMNMFAVREDEQGFILDQNLIQRSSDFITASFINASQYIYLGLSFVEHLTYVTGKKWRLGKFKYDINNLHCYDRHEKYIAEILNNEPLENQPRFKIGVNTDFFNQTIDGVKLENCMGLPNLKERLEIAE